MAAATWGAVHKVESERESMAKKDDAKATKPEDESADKSGTESKGTSDAPAPKPGPRKAPGQKEVIPFKWKVCGYAADGVTLTLFKSVERNDAEAHLARLQKEGYYEGLNIYGVDDPVPAAPQSLQKAARQKKAAKAAAAKKAAAARAKAAKKAKKAKKVKQVKPVKASPKIKKVAAKKTTKAKTTKKRPKMKK